MSILSDAIESSNFSLQNLDNYYDTLNQSSNLIFLKYMDLTNTYCKLFYDTITIQNKNYYTYLFKTGLDTISHVFNNILLYTNNIDLTFYYCQKAYLYFVEFISQIDNVNHSFLQLNGKDASLFVYKKTIFEINNDKRKKFECKNIMKINNIKLLTKIYNDIIFMLATFDSTNLSCINEKTRNLIEKLFNLYNISCSREGSPMKRTGSGFSLKYMEKTASMESLENMGQAENPIINENIIIKSRPKKKKSSYEERNAKTISNDTLIAITLHETIYNYKLNVISEFLNNIHIFYQTDDINIIFTIENNLLLYIDAICMKIKRYDIKKFTGDNSLLNNSVFGKLCDFTPNKFISLLISD